MSDCDVAGETCDNGKCCAPRGCCGGVCCAGSDVHCCGNVCCKTSEFCCGDSGTCCSAVSDACALLVGGAFNNSTLSATCTSTAATLANSTITIPVLVGGSSSTAGTTGSSSDPTKSSSLSLTASPTLAASGGFTDTPDGKNIGGDHISAGVVAGVVVGVLAALLLVVGVWVFWRRRRPSEKAEAEQYKPPGGRYELGIERVDASKNRPEVEGNDVHEMDVPPAEIDGVGPAVLELPPDSRPAEIGHASRNE